MIRKISNIIIAIILLVSTTGFTISKHYCGNELITVEINGEAESCCDSPDCCHTETQFNKLNVDFLGSVSEGQIDENKPYDLFDVFQHVVSYLEIKSPFEETKPFLKILLLRICSFQPLLQNFRL